MADAADAAGPADGMIGGVQAWQQLDLSADAVAKKEATLLRYRQEVRGADVLEQRAWALPSGPCGCSSCCLHRHASTAAG